MTGIIRFYTETGRKLRTVAYFNKDSREAIVKTWLNFYGPKIGYYHVIPDSVIVEKKEVKKPIKDYNIRKRATNDIEMPGVEVVNGLRHESYYHRCYYRGEK